MNKVIIVMSIVTNVDVDNSFLKLLQYIRRKLVMKNIEHKNSHLIFNKII